MSLWPKVDHFYKWLTIVCALWRVSALVTQHLFIIMA